MSKVPRALNIAVQATLPRIQRTLVHYGDAMRVSEIRRGARPRDRNNLDAKSTLTLLQNS